MKGGDATLFEGLFTSMEQSGADFTNTFIVLSGFDPTSNSSSGSSGSGNMDQIAERLALTCASPAIMQKILSRKMKISKPSVQPQQLQALWGIAQTSPEKLSMMFQAPAEAIILELEGEMNKLNRVMALSARIEVMGETRCVFS
jgi:uncharacterized protein YdiU (UPF0061 family)